MLRIALLAVPLVLLSLAPPAAQAQAHDHCAGWLVVDAGAGVYVVTGTDPSHLGLTYVYLESNGIAGLQRGGVSPVTGAPDHCQESDTPDTLVS